MKSGLKKKRILIIPCLCMCNLLGTKFLREEGGGGLFKQSQNFPWGMDIFWTNFSKGEVFDIFQHVIGSHKIQNASRF